MTRQAATWVAQAIAAEIRGRRRELADQDRHAAAFPASRQNPSMSQRAEDLARIDGLVIALTLAIGRPYDMRAAEDLISQAGAPAGVIWGTLQAEAGRLAGQIDDLGRSWDAAAGVDPRLGDDVVRAGQGLVYLASMLAAAISQQDPRRAAQLYDLSAELAEAVDYYASLEEHDTDASAGVFGRLGPGIAYVLRIIHAPRQPVATGPDGAGRCQAARRPSSAQPGPAAGQCLAGQSRRAGNRRCGTEQEGARQAAATVARPLPRSNPVSSQADRRPARPRRWPASLDQRPSGQRYSSPPGSPGRPAQQPLHPHPAKPQPGRGCGRSGYTQPTGQESTREQSSGRDHGLRGRHLIQ